MLSLRLPIPSENALAPLKTKPSRFLNPRTQTHLYCLPSAAPKPQAKLQIPRATTADVARKDLEEEEPLPEGLRRELMPKHVAVIMDGNGRWAKQRGLPPGEGHKAGVESLRAVIEISARYGIKVLTVFAFSYDNWIRPKVEVEFLMSLFEEVIKSELDNFAREGIRVSVIGDSTKLPISLQKLIADAEEKTKENSIFQLIVAVSYSGKYDVLQACKSIAQKAKDGLVQVEDIDESLIEQELETNCTEFPYPDLLIRTSGELRVSNFLLWQLAYTELFFAPEFWPDFGKDGFVEALVSFQQRQRRYGGRNT
ncbi:dehydrodolichyl diphosphate synthase 2 [Humulus lupulus]|uniref:dehydrodolichyl diphosphate synthase 2 n=1 Tax=Humulus lupulus TaxID=3486 RepID=UPI002B41457A|nr:dehydrodolichyl diphosphate synthase 2 [Humulus lupulus]